VRECLAELSLAAAGLNNEEQAALIEFLKTL
jgi:hypothetical protein